MSKSTPIEQIRKNEDNSELVNNILNDFDQNAQMQAPQMQGPQMQGPQMQGPQMQQPQIPAQDSQYSPDANDYEEEYDQGPIEHYNDREFYPQEQPKSMSDRIIHEVKGPVLVAVLVILMNMEVVNNLLMRYIPKAVGNGNMNYMGLAFKGIIAGVIFYLVKYFLM